MCVRVLAQFYHTAYNDMEVLDKAKKQAIQMYKEVPSSICLRCVHLLWMPALYFRFTCFTCLLYMSALQVCFIHLAYTSALCMH